MDDLEYKYDWVDSENKTGLRSNRLYHVRDNSTTSNEYDIHDMGEVDVDHVTNTSNFAYDKSGNLIQDKSEEISNITWTSTGKVKTIARPSTSERPEITFSYDAFGHRISKTTIKKITNTPDPGVYPVPPTTLQEITTTYYVRDAQGNELCSYSYKDNPWGEGTGWNTNNGKILQINDHTIYGSSRLGTSKSNKVFGYSFRGTVSNANPTVVTRMLGLKNYELSNHLGNVMQTVTDRKLPVLSNNLAEIKYYTAEVVSYSDYYPFGMTMPGRNGNSDVYNRGYQGSLKDNEIKGAGNSYDFGARMYDPRIGRWFSTDKLFAKRPAQSPYSFVGNNPIINKEIDGNDYEVIFNKSDKGNTITIKTTVYTDVKGSDSHSSTKSATEFWNSQNGKFKYQVIENDGSKTEYDIVFDITPVPTNSKIDAQSSAIDDVTGNSLTVHPDSDIQGGAFGATEKLERSFVAESRKTTDTPAHELGHDLNLGHFPEGIMKEIDKEGKITRESIVTKENVQQIIDFAIGKTAGHESTMPEGGVAKTKVSNSSNVKTEGTVIDASTTKK